MKENSRGQLVYFALLGFAAGCVFSYNDSCAAYLDDIGDKLGLRTVQLEAVTSMVFVGEVLVIVLVGLYLADRFSNVSLLMVGCCISLLALALALGVGNFGALITSRLFIGFGNGLVMNLTPLLLVEAIFGTWRGSILATFEVGCGFGFFLPYVVQIPGENWRLTMGIGSVFIVMLLCLLFFYPRETVKMIVDSEDPLSESLLPKEFPVETDDDTSHWKDWVVVVGVAFAYNCCDPVLFYSPQLVQEFGYSEEKALTYSLIFKVAFLCTSILTLFFIYKFPRRVLYLTGLTLVCVSYFACASIFYLPEGTAKSGLLVFSLLMIVLGTSTGPALFYVVLAELFECRAQRVRSIAIGSVLMLVFELVINQTLLSLFDAINVSNTLILFGVLFSLDLVMLFMWLPETSAKVMQT